MRVLVVEDNADVAETIGWLIESLGHEVVVCGTAEHCLAKAAVWKPEAVVTDIGLPGIDGYRLANLLHQQPELLDVPIFTLSAYKDDPVRRQESGIKAHYVKPVSLLQLREMLTF